LLVYPAEEKPQGTYENAEPSCPTSHIKHCGYSANGGRHRKREIRIGAGRHDIGYAWSFIRSVSCSVFGGDRAGAVTAGAQDPDTLDPTPPGSLNPEPLPPLPNPLSPKTPARELFARKLTPFHTDTDLIRTAAQDPAVTHIFVNAAIKKALCRESASDRTWLARVRPWYGHAEHFHVRIDCPADSPACKPQPPVPDGDGCGRDLEHWIKHPVVPPAPSLTPEKPKPGITLARLPAACKEIVMTP
jgi:hypothetical protein